MQIKIDITGLFAVCSRSLALGAVLLPCAMAAGMQGDFPAVSPLPAVDEGSTVETALFDEAAGDTDVSRSGFESSAARFAPDTDARVLNSIDDRPKTSARFDSVPADGVSIKQPTKPAPTPRKFTPDSDSLFKRRITETEPTPIAAAPVDVPQDAYSATGFDRVSVREYFVDPNRLSKVTQYLKSVYGNTPDVAIAADFRQNKITIMAGSQGHEIIGRFLAGQGLQPVEPFTANPVVAARADSREYKLRYRDWQDLEGLVAHIWGNRTFIRTSEDGRSASVLWPVSYDRSANVRINHIDNAVYFDGDEKDIDAWWDSMRILDTAPTAPNQVISAVPVAPKDQDVIRQALSMYHMLRLRETEQAHNVSTRFNSMDSAPRHHSAPRHWGGNVAMNMFGQRPNQVAQLLPATQEAAAQEAAENDGPEEQGRSLSGDVSVKILPDGTMVITGSPRDTQQITDMVNRLVEAAKKNTPEVDIVPLKNVDGAQLQQIIQEIYDSSYAPRLGPASTTNLGKPNAIMIVGSKESVASIKDLIEKLDQPSEATDGFAVFRMKHMSAIDAAARLSTLFGIALQTNLPNQTPQAAEGVNAAPQLRVVPDYRSNTVIVQGSPRELAEAKKFLEALDVEDTGEEGATQEIKIFPLKHSIAAELAPVLQDALNGQLSNSGQGYLPAGAQGQQNQNTQNNQQQVNPLGSQIRSAMIRLKLIDPTGETVTSSLTFDVRVSADANSNRLIVTGPSKSMDLIGLLIEQLDRLPDAESVVNVFQIVNGDATLLADTLQNLFTGQTQQQGFGQGQSSLGTIPIATGSGEVSLVGLQFAVDRRTNSIVAAGSRADMNVVEDLLSRLDEDQLTNRIHRVFRLQHVNSDLVAQAIQNWISSRENTDGIDPTLGSEFQIGKRSVAVVSEVESNSLIVSATPEYYELVRNIIKDIDRRKRVLVQAVLAQVTLSGTDEFGFEWGLQDSVLFDRGLSTIGFPFNQVGIGNDTGTAAGVGTREDLAGQALSNLSLGRNNGDVGYGGLVLSAGNESVTLLLRALKDRGNTRILSRPQIMTLENLRGFTQVGQDIPTPSLSQPTALGTTTSYEYQNTGIQLGVLPRVSADGTIYMEVDVTNSALATGDGIPIQSNTDGTVITAPIINTTTAQTTVTARSGQTIVVGGLITDTVAENRRGIPILSDAPLIGPLFRFDSNVTNRTELLIILRPIVVDDDETLAQVNQLEMDRMHWCYSDVVDVHGPLDHSPIFEDGETEVIYSDGHQEGMPYESGEDVKRTPYHQTVPYFTESEMEPIDSNVQLATPPQSAGGATGTRTAELTDPENQWKRRSAKPIAQPPAVPNSFSTRRAE